MALNAWDVFVVEETEKWVESKLIDTVYFAEECDAQYVHSSLVNHDGYRTDIIVRNDNIHSQLHSGDTIEDFAYYEGDDSLINMYCWPKNNLL